ncbi:MAG: YkgJ family cysteine cluster protein [Nitrospinota bacterium]|nr:YkgJ family cysteine cluster protein [Nitrospinota bacterium]
MNTIIKREGFDYSFNPSACQGCGGRCCCGESGGIWISDKDIDAISNLLEINSIDFISQYTTRTDNRLSLKERITEKGFECIFFSDKNGCTIYSARPKQCREYPFWEIFKSDKERSIEECPGVIRE